MSRTTTQEKQSFDARLNEELLRDVLTNTFASLSDSGSAEEGYLAQSMLGLFPTAVISVVYSMQAGRTQRFAGGTASIDSLRELTPDEIQTLLSPTDNSFAECHRSNLTIWTSVTDSQCKIVIQCRHAKLTGVADTLVLQLDSLDESVRDRAIWLSSYVAGLFELYIGIKALKSVANLAEIRHGLESLKGRRDFPVSETLRDIQFLIDEILHHWSSLRQAGYLRELENISAWAADAVLDRDSFDGRSPSLTRYEIEFFDKLYEASKQLGLEQDPQRSDDGAGCDQTIPRLRSLCVVATSDTAYLKDCPDRPSELELELLTTWVPLYRRCRSVQDSAKWSADEDSYWDDTMAQTIPILRTLLCNRFQSVLSLEWLHLWLCVEVLTKRDDFNATKQLFPKEKWRFRADLAFVVREVLRQWYFPARSRNPIESPAYTDALLTLIERHAHDVAGLSENAQLRKFLLVLGEARHQDDKEFVAGHLRHSFQVYVAGHFLCSLKISSSISSEKKFDDWTVTEVLASSRGTRPGSETQKQFLQAFSLSSLFHDIGLFLFPRMFFRPENLSGDDPQLQDAFNKIESQIREAATTLLKTCEETLANGRYFDSGMMIDFSGMLSKGNGGKRVNAAVFHSILSAWYLHRTYEKFSDIAPVLRPAVRAVFLHQVPDGQTRWIKGDEDPVAGLLILCDQIFEWLRGREPADGRYSLDQRHALRGSRFNAIRLPELALPSTDNSGAYRLLLNDESFNHGWPQVDIELIHPDYLSERPYRFWFTFAQNLSRFRKSDSKWGGNVIVKSQVPTAVRNATSNMWRFLQDAVTENSCPYALELRTFLNQDRFIPASASDETVCVGSLDEPFHVPNLEKLFEWLDQHYTKVVGAS